MVPLSLNLAVLFIFMSNTLLGHRIYQSAGIDSPSNSFGSADIQCNRDVQWDLRTPVSCSDGYVCWTTANMTMECTEQSDSECKVGVVCMRDH
ncbi:uncharacterized protein B0H18DRAFT_986881 [Fomitopsis serialis]|uniref:uncharacterized protein n=1 Tax=Fomitopsis serialis TaxID=139415 RepID=UPI002007CC7D|nr:uncharacterized protein B0H18DRAFT_986881 [Neoantrodia serialis]KAH9932183.1 hypothetical protein B0H18DRAFT_986881 [Neoantrodia serialis]